MGDLPFKSVNHLPDAQGRFIQKQSRMDPVADRYLGDVRHSGSVDAGASYSVDTAWRLSRDLVGPYYVFVVTDVGRTGAPRGVVFEAAKEGNNATASANPVLI